MTSTQKILALTGAGILLFSFRSRAGSPAAVADGMMGDYFSYDEFTGSNTCEAHNIPNVPNDEQLERGVLFTYYILDPVRRVLGPITVNSWLRTGDCNAAVGGVPDSAHTEGGTADIEYFLNGSQRNDLIIRAVLTHAIPFDRILLEAGDFHNPNWIHIEYDGAKSPDEQRGEIWVMNNGPHGYQITRHDAEQIFL